MLSSEIISIRPSISTCSNYLSNLFQVRQLQLILQSSLSFNDFFILWQGLYTYLYFPFPLFLLCGSHGRQFFFFFNYYYIFFTFFKFFHTGINSNSFAGFTMTAISSDFLGFSLNLAHPTAMKLMWHWVTF